MTWPMYRLQQKHCHHYSWKVMRSAPVLNFKCFFVLDTLIQTMYMYIMKVVKFQGDITDISTIMEPMVVQIAGTAGRQRCVRCGFATRGQWLVWCERCVGSPVTDHSSRGQGLELTTKEQPTQASQETVPPDAIPVWRRRNRNLSFRYRSVM